MHLESWPIFKGDISTSFGWDHSIENSRVKQGGKYPEKLTSICSSIYTNLFESITVTYLTDHYWNEK